MNRTLHSTFGCRVSLVSRRPSQRRPPSAPCCASSREGTKFKTGEVKYAFAGTLGLLAEAEVARSLKFLSANGCGLPSGAGGVEGLVEGLSYLGVVGIFVASVASYIRTGQGLPTGRPGYVYGLPNSLATEMLANHNRYCSGRSCFPLWTKIWCLPIIDLT